MRLIILLLFFSTQLLAQDILLEQDVKFKHESFQSFIIPNPDNNNFNILQIDHKNIKISIVGERFQAIDSINIEMNEIYENISQNKSIINKKLKLLNHKISEEYCYLYFTSIFNTKNLVNLNNKPFILVKINLNNKKHTIHELPISLKKEKLLNCFFNDDKLYFLSIQNKSSILQLYTIQELELLSIQKFDFSQYKFGKNDDKNLFLSIKDGAYYDGIPYNRFYIPFIKNIEIESNLKTYRRHKIYLNSNTLFLTEDSNEDLTRVISIQLNDLSYHLDVIKQDLSTCNSASPLRESNSFILDNHLYQVTVCNAAITLSINNLDTKEMIQTFKTTKDEILSKTKLEKLNPTYFPFFSFCTDIAAINNKSLLKQISKKKISISSYHTEDQININIDGVDISTGGSPIDKNFGNDLAPVIYHYQSYKNLTRYFNPQISSKNFEHIPSTKPDALDKIKSATTKHTTGNSDGFLFGKTIIPYKDGIIFGYYNRKKKKYYIRKYSN